MNTKTYDLLKWIAQYFLPALGTLYFALSGIWGFPNGEQVVGSITAIDIFLGVILGFSSAQFNKAKDGVLMIDLTNLTKDTYRLLLNTPLEELANKSSIKLNVNNNADLSDNIRNPTPK
jgi:hypothetical protein